VHQLRLAAFYAGAGEASRASQILQRFYSVKGLYEDFLVASALAALGRDEEALRRLKSWKSAMEDRREHLGQFRWWLKSDPNFKKLREAGSLACCLEPGPGKSG
jgi:hypothetical protein